MSTFKAGIIGCGGRGRSHARGYQASADVDIVACSDPVEDARNAFAEEFEFQTPTKTIRRCWIQNRWIL